MNSRLRNAIGLLVSIGVFGLVNYFHFSSPITCSDCSFPYGLPFAWFRDDGYAGGGGLVWSGVALDLLVVVCVGLVFSWMLKILPKRECN